MIKKKTSKISPENEVLKVLKTNLKYLAADGGGIEIVGANQKKGIVEIRMTGGCSICPFRDLTFARMIAKKLKDKIAWIKDIKLVK